MPTSITNTGITFPNGTTQTTAATSSGGTVTSVATGNGLQGGTITTSGTLSIACPGWNTVGSYAGKVQGWGGSTGYDYIAGSNYSVGTSAGQLTMPGASGTWRFMSVSQTAGANEHVNECVACRVS